VVGQFLKASNMRSQASAQFSLLCLRKELVWIPSQSSGVVVFGALECLLDKGSDLVKASVVITSLIRLNLSIHLIYELLFRFHLCLVPLPPLVISYFPGSYFRCIIPGSIKFSAKQFQPIDSDIIPISTSTSLAFSVNSCNIIAVRALYLPPLSRNVIT
jgi:hypothetical protein